MARPAGAKLQAVRSLQRTSFKTVAGATISGVRLAMLTKQDVYVVTRITWSKKEEDNFYEENHYVTLSETTEKTGEGVSYDEKLRAVEVEWRDEVHLIVDSRLRGYARGDL